MNKSIGIIGLGFLGGAMDKYFSEQGLTVSRYDKKGIGSEEEINRAEIVFVCVNTPFDDKKQDIDLSYIESAIGIIGDRKIIVIRSTVPPGTTDYLQEKFPQHFLLFNPEFLRAATPYEDFINPHRQVVGFTEKSRSVASEILSLLPKAAARHTKILPAKAVELLKYAANSMLTTKVALANKIFDFAQNFGVDYEDIKELIGADARVGTYGLEVLYEEFRGYNGTCFPKDIRTFIALGQKKGINVDWLKAMDDENLRLLSSQGIKPNYGYPEGFRK